jgi:hypothetical protein
LVPTVGPVASGGIGDTIAIGRVLYARNIPIVPNDECWISARENAVHCSVIPIGGIHIFIGETLVTIR